MYWDQSRNTWSFCPVKLGAVDSNSNITGRAVTTISFASLGIALPGEQILERGVDASQMPGEFNLVERQPSSLTLQSAQTTLSGTALTTFTPISTTETLTTNNVPPTASSTRAAHMSATATSAPGTLVDVGPYSCTSSINLELFTQALASHLDSSQTDLNATLKYIILNLHAAAPSSNPNGSPNNLTTESLPRGDSLLSDILSSSMDKYLYTPDDLQTQREDLNTSASWFDVLRFNEPLASYFHVDGNGQHTSTPDGWPSESFVQMQRAKRLFAGFGQVDSAMSSYNFSADSSVIFPSDYLQSRAPVTINNDGQVEDGCFFKPSVTAVSSTNNSWAMDFDSGSSSKQSALQRASNLTYCGISPILNETLRNITADEAYGPYLEYAQNTIWSWAPGEPRNSGDSSNSRTAKRCAVINAITGYWQIEDCTKSHYSACRHNGQPYQWSISASDTSYAEAAITCDDGTEFTVPRTSLENTYLLHKWRNVRSDRGIDDELLWVNFNDLDVAGCWAVGENATCPYLPQMGSERQIIVPTVAAVIVFVLAALTVFVKCASNRQRSKRRRRRGDDGWDYEGVPS